MPSNTTTPTGVLLMTMGDPASVDEVFPFLLRLFSDPAIIRAPAPIRYPLALYISLKKLAAVQEKYRIIGGGSPMNGITKRQAEALEKKLSGHGSFKVYVANRYSRPSTKDAYRKIKADGVKKLVALPLYPHYSSAITGSSFAALENLIKHDASAPEVVWVKSIATDPKYNEALAARIDEALAAFPEDVRDEVEVIFSAHSLPEEFIEQGDSYVKDLTDNVEALAGLIKPRPYHVSFQSKGRPSLRWLKPETENELRELAQEGCRGVLIVPISFVSENIETLYDVDVLYRNMARELGIAHFARSKCLNDDPALIDALAGVVLNNL